MTLPPAHSNLSASAVEVLHALDGGGATFRDLLVRVRPMGSIGLERSIAQLESAGLVRVSSMSWVPCGGAASAPVPYVRVIRAAFDDTQTEQEDR